MTLLGRSASLLAFMMLLNAETQSAERPSLTPAMHAAIQHIAPGARILQLEDVDATNCDDVPDNPGLVLTDFDGDGRPDLAVLVKTDSGKEITWEGRKLRLSNYTFSIMADDGNGGYAVKFLRRFEDHSPLAAFIAVQGAGKFRDRDTGKEVTTKYPGVTLVFCEKSEALYHFVGRQVHTVQLGD